jgi:hypothetical protein
MVGWRETKIDTAILERKAGNAAGGKGTFVLEFNRDGYREESGTGKLRSHRQ